MLDKTASRSWCRMYVCMYVRLVIAYFFFCLYGDMQSTRVRACCVGPECPGCCSSLSALARTGLDSSAYKHPSYIAKHHCPSAPLRIHSAGAEATNECRAEPPAADPVPLTGGGDDDYDDDDAQMFRPSHPCSLLCVPWRRAPHAPDPDSQKPMSWPIGAPRPAGACRQAHNPITSFACQQT